MRRDKKLIPHGDYCYKRLGVDRMNLLIETCPYWSIDREREEQCNGYCAYLKHGDWQTKGIGLLWDQVKECGINMEYENGEWVYCYLCWEMRPKSAVLCPHCGHMNSED